eukprot:scaffold128032_cov66-Phaeocystis_antarctica.AAC.4
MPPPRPTELQSTMCTSASRDLCALHIDTVGWKFTFAKDEAARSVDSPAITGGMAVADRAVEHGKSSHSADAVNFDASSFISAAVDQMHVAQDELRSGVKFEDARELLPIERGPAARATDFDRGARRDLDLHTTQADDHIGGQHEDRRRGADSVGSALRVGDGLAAGGGVDPAVVFGQRLLVALHCALHARHSDRPLELRSRVESHSLQECLVLDVAHVRALEGEPEIAHLRALGGEHARTIAHALQPACGFCDLLELREGRQAQLLRGPAGFDCQGRQKLEATRGAQIRREGWCGIVPGRRTGDNEVTTVGRKREAKVGRGRASMRGTTGGARAGGGCGTDSHGSSVSSGTSQRQAGVDPQSDSK